MRAAERLKASASARDLVAAFDLDAGGEIAGAERLDAGLQALQPARQPAHHRIGADRDRERDAAQQEQKPDERRAVARRRAHHEPAAVRQVHGPGRPLRSVDPSAGIAAAAAAAALRWTRSARAPDRTMRRRS